MLYPSPQEGLAWLEASDEAWAGYGRARYAAAAERREDETPADDGTT